MKKCFKCGQQKPLTEFYPHPQMADGYLGKCKSCAKTDAASHRQKNLELVRAYDRARGKLPHRIKLMTETTKRWREEHPGRSAAHSIAQRTHRKAPRCCQLCGGDRKLERHHPDYELPTLIVWVCKPCHVILDEVRRRREQGE